MYKGILNTAILGGAVCLFATGIVALRADEAGNQKSESRLDGNGDGLVSWREAAAFIPGLTERQFKAYDINRDGLWSRNEILARASGSAQPHTPKLLDADKDGKVSLDEFMAAAPNATESNFNGLDRNRDGVLTGDETPAMFRSHDAHNPAFADTNCDGKVSFEEAQAMEPKLTLEQFTDRDRNGDGVLTPEDCPSPRPVDTASPEPASKPSEEG